MKLKGFSVFIFLFLFWKVGTVSAATGQELFYNTCLQCHQSKISHEVAPVDKASTQWRRFFKRKKHKRRHKVDLSPIYTRADLKKILDFLIDHASDSDQPQVAGTR